MGTQKRYTVGGISVKIDEDYLHDDGSLKPDKEGDLVVYGLSALGDAPADVAAEHVTVHDPYEGWKVRPWPSSASGSWQIDSPDRMAISVMGSCFDDPQPVAEGILAGLIDGSIG